MGQKYLAIVWMGNASVFLIVWCTININFYKYISCKIDFTLGLLRVFPAFCIGVFHSLLVLIQNFIVQFSDLE